MTPIPLILFLSSAIIPARSLSIPTIPHPFAPSRSRRIARLERQRKSIDAELLVLRSEEGSDDSRSKLSQRPKNPLQATPINWRPSTNLAPP